jgi:hypothetical protein
MGGAGVSASTARRPQSRLAMQGQPWARSHEIIHGADAGVDGMAGPVMPVQ